MTFSNVQVPLRDLPGLDGLAFEPLHPRHARLVAAVALAWGAAGLAAGAALLFGILVPNGRLSGAVAWIACAALGAVLAASVWLAHRSASVVGFALRQHDVTVRSGIFWRRETVQPIRRIQHVEQHQGPVDRRFGLYTLKLFSAGTGHFTFRIPGLDADTAARIRRHVTVMTADAVSAAEGTSSIGEAIESGGRPSRPERRCGTEGGDQAERPGD